MRLLLILALILTAAIPTFGQSPPPVTLKVATTPYVSNTILRIALEAGFFREQGLDVQLITFRSSPEYMPLLVKGDLDAGPPILNAALFNAVAQGAALKIVMPFTVFSTRKETATAFVARKADLVSGKYGTPAGWKGARIGIATAVYSSQGYIIATHLKKAGLTLKDVSVTTLDSAVLPEALAKGQIDLALTSEPALTRLLLHPDLGLLLAAETVAPQLTSSVFAYGGRLLHDRVLGTRFMKALLKATARYLEGKTAENVRIVSELSGLDEALVRAMSWSDTDLNGRIDVTPLMGFQTWLKEVGQVDTVLPPAAFLDPGFVEAAQDRREP